VQGGSFYRSARLDQTLDHLTSHLRHKCRKLLVRKGDSNVTALAISNSLNV